MRINQYIAKANGMSRREADMAIEDGRVRVNSQPAQLGQAIVEDDKVELDRKLLELQENIYLVMNKPEGYVCSRNSQSENKTIYSLLPDEYKHLKIAGRLDKDSSGLLILSNDGEYLDLLMHPKHSKTKVYEIELNKNLSDADKDHIEDGVELEDGSSKFKLSGSDRAWVVTMEEGRNRQIRRTFAVLDYDVSRLHRVSLGDHKLGDLSSGSFEVVQKII